MVVVTLFNQLVYVFSVDVPETKRHVIYETLESDRFVSSFAEDFCFNLCHEDVGKSDRHFSSHGRPVCLKVVAFHELE